jgi:hypothetical protein
MVERRVVDADELQIEDENFVNYRLVTFRPNPRS